MAETPTIITCPAGTFTVRPGDVRNTTEKIVCPASPYSIRHEVGIMTGFIAIFILASVAYAIASRSEFWIIDYSFGEILTLCSPPYRAVGCWFLGQKRERGAERGGAVVCFGNWGYVWEFCIGWVREGVGWCPRTVPFVQSSFSNAFLTSFRCYSYCHR